MKIQRCQPQTGPLRNLSQAAAPASPGDQYVSHSQPTQSSPVLRHALIGGAAAATATAGLMLAGQSLHAALNTVGPLAGLGAMGYLIYRTCQGALEPDVPLQAEILDSLLVGRFSDNDKQAVQKALNALGPDNVRRLQEAGVKLVVDSDRVPARAGACYYPGQRLACFRRGSVEKHYVIHELGHALDNLAAKQPHYRSQSDPQLQKNYQLYLEKVHSPQPRRHTQWSEYAQTNHQEYLAEGVTYFLDSDQKKAELHSKDPQHYEYIEKFLQNPGNQEK